VRGLQNVPGDGGCIHPAANMETMLAAKTKRNGRWLRMARIVLL
jgi:hypothetical protein